MWEITSYGTMPYSGLKTQEVQRKVREGLRLQPEPGTNEDYFAIAQSCWRLDRAQRPKFSVGLGAIPSLCAMPVLCYLCCAYSGLLARACERCCGQC